MTSYFHGNIMTFVKMMFFILLGFFCFGTPTAARRQSGNFELSGGEELVAWGGYGEEKLSRVIISGKIICHTDRHGKSSFHSHSISGAQVAVICSANGKTREVWAKGIADEYGEYIIELPSNLHAIHNIEKICHVNVFRLPKRSTCKQGKHKKIKHASSGGGGVRTYVTRNIHLTSRLSELYATRVDGALVTT